MLKSQTAQPFQIKRGMVFFIEEPSTKQNVPCNNGIKKSRPYLVISNNLCNIHSSMIHVVPMKTDHDVQKNAEKWYLIQYTGKYGGNYIIDVSSIMLVDKTYCNISSYSESNTRNITDEIMDRVDYGIMRQFGLEKTYQKIGEVVAEPNPFTSCNAVETVEVEHTEEPVAEVVTNSTSEVVIAEPVVTPAIATPDSLTIKIDGMDALVKSFTTMSETLAQYIGSINREPVVSDPVVSEPVVEDVAEVVETVEIPQEDEQPEREVACLDIPVCREKRFRRKPFTHNERLAFLNDCKIMTTDDIVAKYSKYGIDTPKKAWDAKRNYAKIESRELPKREKVSTVKTTKTTTAKKGKKHNMCVNFPDNEGAIRRAIKLYENHGVEAFLSKYKKYGFKTAKHVYNFVQRNKKKYGIGAKAVTE